MFLFIYGVLGGWGGLVGEKKDRELAISTTLLWGLYRRNKASQAISSQLSNTSVLDACELLGIRELIL